jgi:tyrosyl-tRNA synthetase
MKSTLSVQKDSAQIAAFLDRAVENVYPNRGTVAKVLETGKRLRIYLGIDPTGPSLHLGHAIALRKLAELQKLGHEVIMLIGDFTAMIGDPTDKSATRQQLTRKEVLANCKMYQKQASHIISFTGKNAAKLMFNSKWLAKMSFADVMELATHFTVQQLSERDMFEKRMDEGKPVFFHEFMYPLMQGYDSVAMDVDMEIGGNDQTFNMLAGRTLMREMKKKEKFVLTCKLLTDPTGKKMGKSEGNMITLSDSADDMYGKVMSWTDGMIAAGFELCTDVPMEDIKEMEQKMKAGANPMMFKRRLAKEVVAAFVSPKAAADAEAHFSSVHQKGEKPEDMIEVSWTKGMTIVDALVESHVVSSKTDARRQIEQGGVKVNDAIVKDGTVTVKKGDVIQKGKRFFLQLS